MSKIKKDIMGKINSGEVKMRSRNFFILTRALAEIAFIAAFGLLIFIFNLTFYLPKRGAGAGMGRGRLILLFNSLPWGYLIIGLLGLGLLIWLLYRYTGLYKKHFLWIAGIVAGVVLLTAYLISMSNINENLEQKRHMKRFYRQQQNLESPGLHRGPRFLK